MVKSAKSHLDEEDDADGYDSSSYRGEVAKIDGKSSEQKTNTHRSKHSETEQRRRSKINERFQILRDLIPQNDQKRDKASFLLEVIEYIQFLQEKLQMYEGPYQGWGQEPTKLTPWKNHPSADALLDHSQVLKNDSTHESSGILTNVHSSIESDLGTSTVPFNLQFHPNMLAAGKSSVPAQPVQESISDAENVAFLPQSQQWHSQPCAAECDALNTTTSNGQEEPLSETGAVSISSTYSQGILDSLTHALRSSGVDLSQTNISVQIDVSKQASSFAASSSKNQGNPFSNNQVTEDSQARKRSRREKS